MRSEAAANKQPSRAMRWFWWTLILSSMLGGVVFFVTYDSASTVLTDGTKVRYLGYVRGEPLPHSEFEEALYAYSADDLDPPGILKVLQRVLKQQGPPALQYLHAPLLFKVSVKESEERHFEGNVTLQDDFGAGQSLGSRRRPLFYNSGAMPQRSEVLAFQFAEHHGGASGVLKFRNPCYSPTPAFTGKPAPVSASTPAGTVQLSRAVWRNLESDSSNWPSVLLEFDVSQCAELLPCQVIGARITDPWGNSELIRGAPTKGGKAAWAVWEPMGLGTTTIQDSHWRVRLALCHGMGAKLPVSHQAVFKSLPMDGTSVEHTRQIGPQKVTLKQFAGKETSSAGYGRMCFATVELPGAALDEWPVLIGVTGHLAGGGTEVLDAFTAPEVFQCYPCHPIRIFRAGHGPDVLATRPTFDIRYTVAAKYESLDLCFAIERPVVFQFDMQVSDWPVQHKN